MSLVGFEPTSPYALHSAPVPNRPQEQILKLEIKLVLIVYFIFDHNFCFTVFSAHHQMSDQSKLPIFRYRLIQHITQMSVQQPVLQMFQNKFKRL